MFGFVLTIITTSVLTLISVTLIFNMYVGACFIFIGSLMVLKIYGKNKKISIELGPSANTEKKEGDPESEGLMEQESFATKSTAQGGLAADLLHVPLALTDSSLLDAKGNKTVNI